MRLRQNRYMKVYSKEIYAAFYQYAVRLKAALAKEEKAHQAAGSEITNTLRPSGLLSNVRIRNRDNVITGKGGF